MPQPQVEFDENEVQALIKAWDVLGVNANASAAEIKREADNRRTGKTPTAYSLAEINDAATFATRHRQAQDYFVGGVLKRDVALTEEQRTNALEMNADFQEATRLHNPQSARALQRRPGTARAEAAAAAPARSAGSANLSAARDEEDNEDYIGSPRQLLHVIGDTLKFSLLAGGTWIGATVLQNIFPIPVIPLINESLGLGITDVFAICGAAMLGGAVIKGEQPPPPMHPHLSASGQDATSYARALHAHNINRQDFDRRRAIRVRNAGAVLAGALVATAMGHHLLGSHEAPTIPSAASSSDVPDQSSTASAAAVPPEVQANPQMGVAEQNEGPILQQNCNVSFKPGDKVMIASDKVPYRMEPSPDNTPDNTPDGYFNYGARLTYTEDAQNGFSFVTVEINGQDVSRYVATCSLKADTGNSATRPIPPMAEIPSKGLKQ